MSESVTAFCAPGRKAIAELVLAMRGEEVGEVTESPVLEGSTDIIVADMTPLAVDPLAFTVAPPGYDLAAALMREGRLSMWLSRPSATPLISGC